MSDFIMPSLGADMKEGILVAWRVKPGDRVAHGDIVAEIETQKGVFEVEAFDAGIVGPLLVEPGPERIAVGTVLTTITGPEIASARAGPEQDGRARISPAARKLAEDKRIDLHDLAGSGPGGAVVLVDIERAIAAGGEGEAAEAAPEREPTTDFKAGMRQAIAAAMSLSNREIPHYYLATDIDMSAALAWLEAYNGKRSVRDRLLPVVLPLKAIALALKKTPQLNAHWVDGRLQMKESVHIGFAVALRGGGLLTPALHDVDRLSLEQLMSAVADLIGRTRGGKLRGSEMTDAGITVTSLGDLGVKTVFGVIYPPQVGLVGLGRIAQRPWAEGGGLFVRPVLTATLAADHRAGDGHLGAQFLDQLDRLLRQPETLS